MKIYSSKDRECRVTRLCGVGDSVYELRESVDLRAVTSPHVEFASPHPPLSGCLKVGTCEV